MGLEIVAALAHNRVIGNNNTLPWKLPSDLKRFKELTTNHTVIMGRKTWESLPRRPLPNRRNILLSQTGTSAPGAEVVTEWEEIAKLAEKELLFVIGGKSLYELALPAACKIHLTRVHAYPTGNVLFPDFDQSTWRIIYQSDEIKTDSDQYPYHTEVLIRR